MSPIISRAGFSFGFGRRRGGGAAFSATGGTITTQTGSDGITYKVHTFTTPGTFAVTSTSPTFLMKVESVGGGGGGGGRQGDGGDFGGGGGSGLVGYLSNFPITVVGNYPVTVGSGAPGRGPWLGYGPHFPGIGSGGSPTFLNDVTGSPLIVAGAGGGGGAGGGNNFGGGGGGSTLTYPGTTTLLFQYSLPGGAGGEGASGVAPAWGSPNYNPSNILFPSPFAASNYGMGGSSGGAGNQGGFRIYYPVSFL